MINIRPDALSKLGSRGLSTETTRPHVSSDVQKVLWVRRDSGGKKKIVDYYNEQELPNLSNNII